MPGPEPSPQLAAAPSDGAPLDHAAIVAIMWGMMLAMFLSALEQTIVAPALPTIGRTLGDVENLCLGGPRRICSPTPQRCRCLASSPTFTGGGGCCC